MKYTILNVSLTITLTLLTSVAKAEQSTCSLDDKQMVSKVDLVVDNTKTGKRNSSGTAEINLAKHLKKIKAKMYGAFWCPYCTKQKEMFGQKAFTYIRYIECDPRGKNPRPDLCQQAGVRGYPTWEIKGQIYTGMRSLDDLANISGYKGRRDFKN